MLSALLIIIFGVLMFWLFTHRDTAQGTKSDSFVNSRSSSDTHIPTAVGSDALGDSHLTTTTPDDDQPVINPATGLLMIGGVGGLDTDGNPFGTDMASPDDHIDTSMGDLTSGMDAFDSNDLMSSDSFSSFNNSDDHW